MSFPKRVLWGAVDIQVAFAGGKAGQSAGFLMPFVQVFTQLVTAPGSHCQSPMLFGDLLALVSVPAIVVIQPHRVSIARRVESIQFFSPLQTFQHSVLLCRQRIHRRLRRHCAADRIRHVRPPELCQLRLIGHVSTGGRPGGAGRTAIELNQTAKPRRCFGHGV